MSSFTLIYKSRIAEASGGRKFEFCFHNTSRELIVAAHISHYTASQPLSRLCTLIQLPKKNFKNMYHINFCHHFFTARFRKVLKATLYVVVQTSGFFSFLVGLRTPLAIFDDFYGFLFKKKRKNWKSIRYFFLYLNFAITY